MTLEKTAPTGRAAAAREAQLAQAEATQKMNQFNKGEKVPAAGTMELRAYTTKRILAEAMGKSAQEMTENLNPFKPKNYIQNRKDFIEAEIDYIDLEKNGLNLSIEDSDSLPKNPTLEARIAQTEAKKPRNLQVNSTQEAIEGQANKMMTAARKLENPKTISVAKQAAKREYLEARTQYVFLRTKSNFPGTSSQLLPINSEDAGKVKRESATKTDQIKEQKENLKKERAALAGRTKPNDNTGTEIKIIDDQLALLNKREQLLKRMQSQGQKALTLKNPELKGEAYRRLYIARVSDGQAQTSYNKLQTQRYVLQAERSVANSKEKKARATAENPQNSVLVKVTTERAKAATALLEAARKLKTAIDRQPSLSTTFPEAEKSAYDKAKAEYEKKMVESQKIKN